MRTNAEEAEIERQEEISLRRWKRKANLWGWLLGYGWGLADRHSKWAWNNWFMEREPKVWIIALIANEYRD